MASRLLSKIAAGGLSAGVFLIWWPGHFATVGLDALVARGLAWTLSFEILLLAFGPLEDLAWRRVRTRLTVRQERMRTRLDAAPPKARAGGAVALACFAAAVPLMLLSDAGPVQRVGARPAKVVERVVVQKPVVKREVVVREVPVPERTAPAPAVGAATPSPARVARAREKTTVTKQTRSTKPATAKAAPEVAETPATATAPAPDATASEPAAPAADAG